ncbi:hypothetical protein ACFQ0D_24430, partial [Micromonospora zhanjiangensis]
MSFRLRVLGLLVLVAVSATVATTWLVLRQASQQITDTANVDRAQAETIGTRLTDYGREHASWTGVAAQIQDLHRQTGQRIHLVTENGTVIADTDTLAGRTARPLGLVTSFVDPRPALALPAGADDKTLVGITEDLIRSYRIDALFSNCLSAAGIPVRVTSIRYGVPKLKADVSVDGAPSTTIDSCQERAELSWTPRESLQANLLDCLSLPGRQAWRLGLGPTQIPVPGATAGQSDDLDPKPCLAAAFTADIVDVAPLPARLYLGAPNDRAPLATGPLLAV